MVPFVPLDNAVGIRWIQRRTMKVFWFCSSTQTAPSPQCPTMPRSQTWQSEREFNDELMERYVKRLPLPFYYRCAAFTVISIKLLPQIFQIQWRLVAQNICSDSVEVYVPCCFILWISSSSETSSRCYRAEWIWGKIFKLIWELSIESWRLVILWETGEDWCEGLRGWV